MTVRTDVIVIGAGIHGCSAALHLALRGANVDVIEKDTAGRHASGVNAGGVRTLARDAAEIPLALAALEMWHRISDLVHDSCDFQASAQIMVAETGADMRRLEARRAELERLGFRHEELVDRAELRNLLPAVSDHCLGGLIARRDGHANPYRTVTAFRRRAAALGARFHEGHPAEAVERSGRGWRIRTWQRTFDAAALVNCGGAWGDRIAAMLGDRVRLEAVAPMMIVTERMPRFVEPVVLGSGRALSLKQSANGTVLIGGGRLGPADRDRGVAGLDFGGLAASARTAQDIFPCLSRAHVVRCWSGIEGRTPDALPVIGPSPSAPGAYHAFGFSLHGFQLGPIVGRVIADLVLDGRTEFPLAPLGVERFTISADTPLHDNSG